MVPIDHYDIIAGRRREAVAVVDGDARLTYDDVTTISRRVAALVARHGNGDEPVPVVLYGANSYRWLAAKVGVMRAGGVVVPLHVNNTAEMSRAFLAATQPKVLFYDGGRAAEVRRIKSELPSLRQCICFYGRIDDDPSLDDIIASGEDYEATWIDVNGNPERPVYYWATSGTTGEPRAVVESVRCFDMALKLACARRAARRNVMLALAPMTHGGGPASFGTLVLGGTVVIPAGFDPPHILSAIQTEGVTDMWLSPTALYLLLEWPELSRYNLSTLRYVMLGTAAVSPQRLKQAVEVFGPCLAHSYGQIETGFVTVLPPDVLAAAAAGNKPERLHSSGSSAHVSRIAIMRDDERLADTGEQGEIVVRGGGVKRYLDRAVTAAAQSTGWHRTGDIGYLDEDGYLYVVGRKKDVVNMAGFKIPAADVERVIMELAEVQECAVVAVPDPMRGEAIQAIVTIKSGQEFSSRAVVKHCVERLGKGKAPHHVDVWPELPRSSVGKIDKRHILQKVLDSLSRRAGVSS